MAISELSVLENEYQMAVCVCRNKTTGWKQNATYQRNVNFK